MSAGLATILAAGGGPLSHVLPHTLFHVGGFDVSNHLFMAVVAALLVLAVFLHVANKVRVRTDHAEPYITHGRLAQMFETVCVFIRDEVVWPNLGKRTDRYIYYVWTVFFFILFANVLGMVPLGPFIQFLAWIFGAADPSAYSHWGGTATSNLALNAPLALCSLIAVVFIGVRESGSHFFKHFAPVPFHPLPMVPIAVLMVVLEVMSLLIRCGVLAMRLFGTMLAGHLVLAVLFGLIFTAAKVSGVFGVGVGIGVLALNVALGLLELFIALLQAFIFTFLTVLFIAEGAAHEEEHEHEPEYHAGHDRAHELEDNGFHQMAEQM